MDVKGDLASLKEVWNAYAAGLNTGDFDGWLSLWIDDGIQMPPDKPAAVGKDQIRANMKGFFDQLTMKMTITDKETRIVGDLAICRGNYTLAVTPKGGGETTKFDGKYLSILEKQADGSWKIARDCFNYNEPPTSSAPTGK